MVLEAILASIRFALVGDTELITICGGTVNLHFGMAAPEDPPFPYLVHDIQVELQADGISLEGFWLCDVWDHNTDCVRAIRIARRVKQILHLATDPTINHAGLEFRGMNPVKTDNHTVKRVVLRFRLDMPDLDLAQIPG